MEYPVPNTKWTSWIADTVAAGVRREDAIPSERWDQIQELGANLVHVSVFPQHVTDGPGNVAAKLARAAWHRNLSLSLSDAWLWERSLSERRIYHPESGADFSTTTAAQRMLSPAFHDDLHSDFHILDTARQFNALRFLPVRDVNTRVGGFMHGGELFAAQKQRDAISGYYVVSLRCSFDPGLLPEADLDVLSVTIGAPAGEVRFLLRSEELRLAADVQPGPDREIVLGRLQIVSGDEQGSTAAQALVDVAPEPGYNQRMPVRDPVSIEIEYIGGCAVDLDAVLLSDERAFALFNPGHPDVAQRHRQLRAEILDRLRLLGADSTAPYPALRYLEMAESLPAQGNFTTARMIGELCREAAGSKRLPVRPHLYATAGGLTYTEAVRMGGAEMRGIVDGRYAYLYEDNYNVHAGDQDYYDTLYFPVPFLEGGRNNWTNGQQYSEWYRMFALSRKQYGVRQWMPPIQNHSWLLRNGTPKGPPFDMTWLYEPSAAELRMSTMMALCYGATSMMMYQLGSWPGIADVPVVRDRNSPAYDDMGSIGFLDPHTHQPRRMDTNGENKWDSARVLITRLLLPLGERLHGLKWENGYNLHRHLHGETEGLLRGADAYSDWESMKRDARDRTFIEAGEFSSDSEPGVRYLLLVNKRVDATGDRVLLLHFSERVAASHIVYPPAAEGIDSLTPGDTVTLQPGCAVLLRITLRD
jgi:hypothetical protein